MERFLSSKVQGVVLKSIGIFFEIGNGWVLKNTKGDFSSVVEGVFSNVEWMNRLR